MKVTTLVNGFSSCFELMSGSRLRTPSKFALTTGIDFVPRVNKKTFISEAKETNHLTVIFSEWDVTQYAHDILEEVN